MFGKCLQMMQEYMFRSVDFCFTLHLNWTKQMVLDLDLDVLNVLV